MDIDDLSACYPRLYHMAERDSWLSIVRHGLLSTAAILQLLGASKREKEKYERAHRPEKVVLQHEVFGSFTLRDQKPMSDKRLSWCLKDGLRPIEWYALLNSKVFFW